MTFTDRMTNSIAPRPRKNAPIFDTCGVVLPRGVPYVTLIPMTATTLDAEEDLRYWKIYSKPFHAADGSLTVHEGMVCCEPGRPGGYLYVYRWYATLSTVGSYGEAEEIERDGAEVTLLAAKRKILEVFGSETNVPKKM